MQRDNHSIFRKSNTAGGNCLIYVAIARAVDMIKVLILGRADVFDDKEVQKLFGLMKDLEPEV